MKLKALSHYNNDTDTRFGDCILAYDSSMLVVYDCGHKEHEAYVESFLKRNPAISQVKIVVSHNDSDHTDGICDLLKWLSDKDYSVELYSHQYLRYIDTILDKIDDGRRNRESLKRSLLAEFDNIKVIIETARELDISAVEALSGTAVGNVSIVGPSIDEFTDVAAKAVDSRVSNKIGSGHAEETVMNAASVQVKVTLDNGETVLLCGDASPEYLKNLDSYQFIQFPHHGQKEDAIAIFERLGGNAYSKTFLISDNTGSGEKSGGSDELVEYMKEEHYSAAYNTRNGEVDVSRAIASSTRTLEGRNYLGDLDCI